MGLTHGIVIFDIVNVEPPSFHKYSSMWGLSTLHFAIPPSPALKAVHCIAQIQGSIYLFYSTNVQIGKSVLALGAQAI